MSHRDDVDLSSEVLTLEGTAPRWAALSAVVGVAGILIGAGVAAGTGAWGRFWHAYLVSFVFWLSLSLGALFFVIILHLTRAGWGISLRRMAEALSANLLFPLAALVLPILFSLGRIYPWTDASLVAHDPVLQLKHAWLNVPFFVIRCVIYFAVWGGLASWFYRRSLQQDDTKDPALTVRMEKASGVATILYGLTVTLFAFDFLMSLDPLWFSTIYGVYFFAGSFLGFLAFLTIGVAALQGTGRIRHAVTTEHYHDMGKLLFGFVIFWAYIGFSQYMLIWYANLPEETSWVFRRQTGGWTTMSLLLLFGHFIVPFLALLSRFPKRRPRFLGVAAAWILLMHWLDIYWLVLPEVEGVSPVPGLLDVACLIGMSGIALSVAVWRLGKGPILPVGDPRLGESLGFENA